MTQWMSGVATSGWPSFAHGPIHVLCEWKVIDKKDFELGSAFNAPPMTMEVCPQHSGDPAVVVSYEGCPCLLVTVTTKHACLPGIFNWWILSPNKSKLHEEVPTIEFFDTHKRPLKLPDTRFAPKNTVSSVGVGALLRQSWEGNGRLLITPSSSIRSHRVPSWVLPGNATPVVSFCHCAMTLLI